MEIPCCPDPAHAGGQVVRAGWYGKAPHRRQRWLCRPSNGDPPHRFAETLPRQQARSSCCLECSTRLEAWEGQPGLRRYDFTASEIAHALKRAGGGASYRDAAAETRELAQRSRAPNPRRGSRWRQMKRDPNLDGQIVANWVDTFALALMEQLPQRWPKVVLVDSINFRISTGIRAGMGSTCSPPSPTRRRRAGRIPGPSSITYKRSGVRTRRPGRSSSARSLAHPRS